jgi:Tol biopolymer transport system component
VQHLKKSLSFGIVVLALAALTLESCSSTGPVPGNGEAILFSEVGDRFLQDSIFLVHEDGTGMQTLFAPLPGKGFSYAEGNSLRQKLLILVDQVTPDQQVSQKMYFREPGSLGLQRLNHLDGVDQEGSLSPSETLVVYRFIANSQPFQEALWVHDFASGQDRQLTSPQNSFDRFPTWQPDGQAILFLRFFISGTHILSTLMRITPAGGDPQPALGGNELITGIAFAPDGKRFAIWTSNGLEVVDSTALNRQVILPRSTLGDRSIFAGSIAWSRTRELIAFVLDSSSFVEHELWTVQTDGSNARAIVTVSDGTLLLGSFLQTQ